MPLGDGKAKNEAQEVNKELGFISEAVSSIADQFLSTFQEAIDGVGELNGKVDVVGKTMQRGLVNSLKQSVRNTDTLIDLQSKVTRGVATQKDIAKEAEKIAKNRAILQARRFVLEGQLTKRQKTLLAQEEEQLDFQEEALDKIKKQNTAQIANQGITGAISKNIKEYVSNLDKSGVAAKLLSGEFNTQQKLSFLSEASILALAKGALIASDNIANIAKNTGVSADEAKRLQVNFAIAAANSDKLFITSKDLNQSFRELTEFTGLIADFGGDTLVSQSTLTKQLGLSAENAGKLATLSRIQSKDTEGVLDNTVAAVGALSKQNKVGIGVKGVLEEISQVSNSIAVSLGKNPVEIAKAVTQAKLLGLSLSEVDAVANSLLDFESSITAELEAELLIGKNLNLEKARLLALNNDLAGLGEELANQEEIRLAFANGNRIQQESAAKVIGVSRDQLASMVLQQDLASMGAEQFRDTYGEVTYQQLQSQSASEKFSSTLEKIQGIVGDIGIAFTPIIDAIASVVSGLAKSKLGAIALVGVMGTLVGLSVAKAIADLYASFAGVPLGLGVPLAIAASAGLLSTVAGATLIGTADDMVAPPGYGDRILSTPKGSIALNNQDTLVAGTNLGGGSDNREAKRTNMLLEQILTKQGTVKIDSVQAGTAFAMNTYQVQ